MRAQFAKARSFEAAARRAALRPADVETIHDMRVAVRRMRSLFRLLAPYEAAPAARHTPSLKSVRRPAQALASRLGQVRDWDVLIRDLRAHLKRLPAARQLALKPLLNNWLARRREAQRALIVFLDGEAYAEWTARLARFLRAPPQKPPAPRLCDEVPALVWRQYAAVRRYETDIAEAALPVLHALRIECKRLRYTLEFFAGALGGGAGPLIETLVAMQDLLGALHDADVACQVVGEFQRSLRRGTVDAACRREADLYRRSLRRRIGRLRLSVVERWPSVTAPSFRRALGEAVAAL